jgi:hypothetical protein
VSPIGIAPAATHPYAQRQQDQYAQQGDGDGYLPRGGVHSHVLYCGTGCGCQWAVEMHLFSHALNARILALPLLSEAGL